MKRDDDAVADGTPTTFIACSEVFAGYDFHSAPGRLVMPFTEAPSTSSSICVGWTAPRGRLDRAIHACDRAGRSSVVHSTPVNVAERCKSL